MRVDGTGRVAGISNRKRRNIAPFKVAAVVVGVCIALPIIYLFVRSADALDEVLPLLFNPRTALVVGRTFLLIAIVAALATTIGGVLAWLTTRTNLPFRKAVTIMSVLPLGIPSFILAITLIELYGPRGVLQGWLEPFGVNRLNDIYGLAGAVLTLTLSTFPYVFLTVRGSLKRMDPSLAEAARSMGFGRFKTFIRVIVPTLRPALTSGVLLVSLYTLSDFGAVSLMRYETLTSSIFIQYESSANRALAAGLALPLVFIAAALLVSEFVSSKEKGGKYFRTGAGASRHLRLSDLKGWRWPALALASLPSLAGIVFPVAVLVWWTSRGFASSSISGQMVEPLFNSIYIALLAAAAATAASIPIAALAAKGGGILATFAEKTAYISFGLPGVVIALGIVFVGVNLVPFLYQSIWLLIAAYGTMFFSGSLGAVKPVFLQINPHVEEAAKCLDAGRGKIFFRITLPAVMPGIATGGTIVFLLVMRELPATLLLSPPGFSTIATVIWTHASEAFFAQAGLASLILVVSSGIPAALLLFFSRQGETRSR